MSGHYVTEHFQMRIAETSIKVPQSRRRIKSALEPRSPPSTDPHPCDKDKLHLMPPQVNYPRSDPQVGDLLGFYAFDNSQCTKSNGRYPILAQQREEAHAEDRQIRRHGYDRSF